MPSTCQDLPETGLAGGGGALLKEAFDICASYVIFKEGGLVKARNGSNGHIDFQGPDATTVIQAALDAVHAVGGGKVYLKDGTFECTNRIRMHDNTTLQGQGRSTILRLADGALAGLAGNDRAAVITNENFHLIPPGNHDIIIRNLVVDANRANQAGQVLYENKCVHLGWVHECLISNVYARNGWAGGIFIYPMNVAPFPPLNSVIENCQVTDCGNGNDHAHCGIFISNGTGLPRRSGIIGCSVRNCNRNGIVAEDGNGTNIIGNSCDGNTVNGIATITELGANIVGNSCYGNGSGGIYMENARYGNVEGNILYENEIGIYNHSGHDMVIVGNTCRWNDEAGIHLETGVYHNVVDGNVCIGNGAGTAPTFPYGIYTRSTNSVFVGNRCANDIHTYKVANSQTHGIVEAAPGNINHITHNHLNGNFTMGLVYVGLQTAAEGNNCGGDVFNSRGCGFATVQEAIDDQAGDGIVHVPEGTYMEAVVIDAADANLILEGEGRATLINGGITGHAILITSADDVVVRNLAVQTSAGAGNAYDGIQINSSDRVKVENVRVSGSDRHGVLITGASTDCEVVSCYTYDADDSGIILDAGCVRAKILHNTVDESGSHCIYSNANSGHFEGNSVFTTEVVNGIVLVSSAEYNVVIHNVIGSVGSFGIVVEGDNNEINSNVINGTGSDGILLAATAENNIVKGNRITAWVGEAVDDDGTGNEIGDGHIYVFGVLGVVTADQVGYPLPGQGAWALTALQLQLPYRGYIRDLRVYALTGPGAAVTDTITARLNGAGTAVTCTIVGAGAQSGSDMANRVQTAAVGDRIDIYYSAAVGSVAANIMITVEIREVAMA